MFGLLQTTSLFAWCQEIPDMAHSSTMKNTGEDSWVKQNLKWYILNETPVPFYNLAIFS